MDLKMQLQKFGYQACVRKMWYGGKSVRLRAKDPGVVPVGSIY